MLAPVAKKVMHMLVEALQLVTFGHKLCLLGPSASRSLIAASRSAIATSRSAMACAASTRKLSRSFGSESVVALTRQAEHMRARMRRTLTGVIQLIAGHLHGLRRQSELIGQ